MYQTYVTTIRNVKVQAFHCYLNKCGFVLNQLRNFSLKIQHTSICLRNWHSKPLAFELPSRASVLEPEGCPFHIWTTFFDLYIIFGKFTSFPRILIAQKSEGDAKKHKLGCWGVERAKLLKYPVRWCWNMYHCSKNMFVQSYIIW